MLVLGCALLLATSVTSMSLESFQQPESSNLDLPENEEGIIHCYCNMPECITTNYMCKSISRGCFSDLVSNLDVDTALHGCIDLLPSERGNECQNVPTAPKDNSASASTSSNQQELKKPASLLLCCMEDMCNHVESPETRTKYNETILATAMLNGSVEREVIGMRQREAASSSQELWFRAATIAVPILGALILLILVLLAMKILRSDVLDEANIISVKLRCKDGSHHGDGNLRCNLNTSLDPDKKQPLLFHYNPCNPPGVHPGVHPVLLLADKNARNARLNTTLSPTGLFDKNLDLGSCNIYHNTTVPLIPPSSREKLIYKKAFVSWPQNQ